MINLSINYLVLIDHTIHIQFTDVCMLFEAFDRQRAVTFLIIELKVLLELKHPLVYVEISEFVLDFLIEVRLSYLSNFFFLFFLF